MFSLFGRPNERAAAVQQLQKVVSGAHVAADDYSLVDVSYGDGRRMRVFLPPLFPKDKPVLQLMEALEHPKVDKYNQVHVEYLDEWTPRHSLAELVSYVVQLLEGVSNDDDDDLDGDKKNNSQETTATTTVERLRSEKYVTPLPEIPASFAAVEAISEEEAERLLADEADFGAFFDDIDAVASMREVREQLRASNARAAADLVATVDRRRAERAVALSEQQSLRAALDAYDDLHREATTLFEPSGAKGLAKAALHTAKERAQRADQESYDLSDDFKAGNIDLPTWHKLYLAKRVEYHTNEGLAHAFYKQQGDIKGKKDDDDDEHSILDKEHRHRSPPPLQQTQQHVRRASNNATTPVVVGGTVVEQEQHQHARP